MTYYTKGKCAEWHVFNTSLCCSKFKHSCRVSEQRERIRERQMMLPLVVLIKFVLLLIIFQISFSFNLLVANWRLSPEFWSPKLLFHLPRRLKWSQLRALTCVVIIKQNFTGMTYMYTIPVLHTIIRMLY